MAALTDVAIGEGLLQRGRDAWGPCPVCGATQRGRADRRGPLHFSGDLWKCHAEACGAGGTTPALLAAVRFGEVPPKGDGRWKEVFAELEGSDRPHPRPVAFRPGSPAGLRNTRNGTAGATKALDYPPLAEVTALWSDCAELTDLHHDDPALAYLASRALDPVLLARLDLVRALRVRGAWPAWLPRASPDPYRLAVPVWDAAAELRSLRFRSVQPVQGRPKAYPPTGFGLGGLVMADAMAQQLLRGDRAGWDGRVLIAEGETDWWSLATHPDRFTRSGQEGETYATFGIVAGSWTPTIAARIPSGARVVVWTDLDDAGDRYAETIRASLAPRCRLWRRPSPTSGTP